MHARLLNLSGPLVVLGYLSNHLPGIATVLAGLMAATWYAISIYDRIKHGHHPK